MALKPCSKSPMINTSASCSLQDSFGFRRVARSRALSFAMSLKPSRNLSCSKSPTINTSASCSLHDSFGFRRVSRSLSLRGGRILCSSSDPSHRFIPSLDYIPNRISDPKYVRVLDTSLQYAEQSPGPILTSMGKLYLARRLVKLGVDIIEAGFPAASKDVFEAVEIIAQRIGKHVDEYGYVPVICGLSRCNKEDIKRTWEAIKDAKLPRIHILMATNNIDLDSTLKKSKGEVTDIARSMVSFARSLGCQDIEFSVEAGRTDKEHLYQIFGEVIKAGATTVCIVDTEGIFVFQRFVQLVADVKANTRGIENVILSINCWNKYGFGTANTLEGALAGARQVEVTLNGVGERAPLDMMVMGIKCLGAGIYSGINMKQILRMRDGRLSPAIYEDLSTGNSKNGLEDEESHPGLWTIDTIQDVVGPFGHHQIIVTLADCYRKIYTASSAGTGSGKVVEDIESAYDAVNEIIKIPTILLDYTATWEHGILYNVTVLLLRSYNDPITGEEIQKYYSGVGIDRNLIVSSVEAYLQALSKIRGSHVVS